MKLAGGWGVAAIIAVAFSWGAVSQVRSQVIQPSIEIPTSVPPVGVAGADVSATDAASPTVIPVDPVIIGETSTTVAQLESESTSTTAAPPTTVAQSNGATTTRPSSTTTTTQPSTTTTEPPESQTSSYELIGGTVSIDHSPGVVTFVTAVPQAGFSTDPRETGPDRVRVRFEGEDHTSDFRAEWEDGELKIIQNETGDN